MKLRKILLLSLSLNLLFVAAGCFYVYKKGGMVDALSSLKKDEAIMNTPLYLDRINLFEKLPLDNKSIVFIGDSITAGNEWYEMFKNPSIKNRGIVGDTTEGLLLRLDPIIDAKPKRIFLLFGTNDLQIGVSVNKISSNYSKAIEKIKTNSPKTEIFIQSVLPINNELHQSNRTNEDIQSLNKKLKSVSDKSKVTYIDLSTSFSRQGELNKVYTHDGLHLNGSGYLLWKDIITPYLD